MSTFAENFYEEKVLTLLHKTKDLQSLMLEVVNLLKQNISQLIVNILSKQEHAEKFVVPALVGSHGPLNDVDIQLKLLYALGFISLFDYKDISLIMSLYNELDHSNKQYSYTDEIILDALAALHCIEHPLQFTINPHLETKENDIIIDAFNNKVKALLIVEFTKIIVNLHNPAIL